MTQSPTYFIGSRAVSIDEYAFGHPAATAALAAARFYGVDEAVAMEYAVGLATQDELIAAVGPAAAEIMDRVSAADA